MIALLDLLDLAKIPATKTFYRRHRALKRAGLDLEDFISEVQREVFKAWDSYDQARDPEPFIRRIAKNTALQALRRDSARKRKHRRSGSQKALGLVLAHDPGPAASASATELVEHIYSLPDDEKQLCILLASHSKRRIQKILDVTASELKHQVSTLAEYLQDWNPSPPSLPAKEEPC